MAAVTGDQIIQDLLHPFIEAMDEQKITPRLLARKLKAELNAKETKFFQKDGLVVESHDVIAWGIRQAARIDAHKLRGDYPSSKVEFPDVNGKPQNISAVFGETERAARLIYLLEQAEKRAKEAKK